MYKHVYILKFTSVPTKAHKRACSSATTATTSAVCSHSSHCLRCKLLLLVLFHAAKAQECLYLLLPFFLVVLVPYVCMWVYFRLVLLLARSLAYISCDSHHLPVTVSYHVLAAAPHFIANAARRNLSASRATVNYHQQHLTRYMSEPHPNVVLLF